MRFEGMNGIERIAFKNVKGVFDWEVGGWYNCIQDGYEEDIPDTEADAKEIIYRDSMNDAARPGIYMTGRAPKEMRFAGEKFIRACIDYLFEKDDDVAAIREVKKW